MDEHEFHAIEVISIAVGRRRREHVLFVVGVCIQNVRAQIICGGKCGRSSFPY